MADNLVTKLESRSCLRAWARQIRDDLSENERGRASSRIAQKMLVLLEVKEAQNILLYSAFRSEVETEELGMLFLRQGKTLCLPLCRPRDKDLAAIVVREEDFPLPLGYQGIPEPVWRADAVFPAQELDMVILPGLLFDRNGNRLGYGGGYYDRFLAGKAPQALRLGLAFSCQLVFSIPAQNHDMRLDLLVTEKEVLRWARRATNSL